MQISDLITIGRLLTRTSKNGLLTFQPYSNFQDRFLTLRDIFLVFKDKRVRLVTLTREVREQTMVVGLLEKDVLEEIRKSGPVEVMIAPEDLRLLEYSPDFYDPLGKKAIYLGKEMGIIRDYFFNSMYDVYIIQLGNGKEVMIPAVDHYIASRDDQAVYFQDIAGLLEL
ncbi:MAG: hypothetical protein JXB60_09690 [Candidatus Cloacimonetes bacterium]|nr:hypothetical protein [Candidatus Cloacimonadota bacterium]